MTTPTREELTKHYIEIWKQTVTVQQHFNDIEWRIRGLALTAATFAIGAAAVATKDGPPFTGTVILLIALLLWYAFYFVDRYWYHPLLKASVVQGEQLESEIEKVLPAAKLTQTISAGSPVTRPLMIRFLTLFQNPNAKLRSENKLAWFYFFGALALTLTAIGLGVVSVVTTATPPNEPTIVRIERDNDVVGILPPSIGTTIDSPPSSLVVTSSSDLPSSPVPTTQP